MNYFACAVVLVAGSYTALSSPPWPNSWPNSWPSWFCLILVAICGFMMDLLLTGSIIYDKSSVVTVMIYSQVVWVVLVDVVAQSLTCLPKYLGNCLCLYCGM